MKADFQLRHATVSRHGSFWVYQTDQKTRDMLRELSRAASVPSRLQHIDAGGAYALNSQRTLKEGVVIDFRDGHFVTAGSDMQSYVLTFVDVGPPVNRGAPYIRENDLAGPIVSLPPHAHPLSSLTASEVAALTADVPPLLNSGVWFLIPKPAFINPITLATVKPGIELVYGIDFFTSKNFIITQLPPAEYFAAGSIVVSIAEVSFESFDAYPSDSPRSKQSRKWTNVYAKRAQSLELFRRAAAEFCGLYVLQDNDVVLNAVARTDGSVVYAFANAGVVTVDYPHTPLTPGLAYPIGYVVCDQFEMITADSHGSTFLTSTAAPVELDGIFGMPVQMPADGLVECSYEFVDQLVRPHLQLYLGGTAEELAIVWAMQLSHERLQGTSLAAELGGGLDDPETFPSDGSFPPVINYADLLTGFYGRRLALLAVSGVPETSKYEFSRFLRENAPTGMIILLADQDAAAVLPPPVVAPPEGNVFYDGQHLHYTTSTLSYE